MIQISIIKTIAGNGGDEQWVFNTKIEALDCASAKQIAIDTDAVFQLYLSPPAESDEPDEQGCKTITLSALLAFLKPDDEAKSTLESIYTAANMVGASKDSVVVSGLNISCNGRTKLSIAAPAIDSGVAIGSSETTLKAGLGFSFVANSGKAFFHMAEMNCREETTG